MVLILFLCSTGRAATSYTAESCALTDVSSKVALASDGDTVIIPSCPSGVTWTSKLNITKAITLQGNGCALDSKGRPTSCNTVIIDGVANDYLMTVTLVANKTTRISSIDFRDGAGGNYGPPIKIDGSVDDNRRFRVDHCIMTLGRAPSQIWVYTAYGVLDHNVSTHSNFFVDIYAPAEWAFSDARWNESLASPPLSPTGWGSEKFVFIEDN